MQTISPSVITSRKAKRHIEKIKADHAELLRNLEAHKVKVQAWKDKKAMEQVQREQAMMEHHKAMAEQQGKQREQEMSHQKEMAMIAAKNKEIEMKRAALAHGD